jgi:hypothetical protein
VVRDDDQGVNSADRDGWTPLFHAVARDGGSKALVVSLLARGADPNHRSATGESVIDVLYAGCASASEATSARECEEILRAHGFRDSGGAPEERHASSASTAAPAPTPHTPYTRPPKLPAALAAPDSPRHAMLLAAVRDRAANIVRTLLEAGADVRHVDEDGRTALHLAARNGDVECVAELLLASAPVDARCRRGRTPLADAVDAGAGKELLGWLLDAGARADEVDGLAVPQVTTDGAVTRCTNVCGVLTIEITRIRVLGDRETTIRIRRAPGSSHDVVLDGVEPEAVAFSRDGDLVYVDGSERRVIEIASGAASRAPWPRHRDDAVWLADILAGHHG